MSNYKTGIMTQLDKIIESTHPTWLQVVIVQIFWYVSKHFKKIKCLEFIKSFEYVIMNIRYMLLIYPQNNRIMKPIFIDFFPW